MQSEGLSHGERQGIVTPRMRFLAPVLVLAAWLAPAAAAYAGDNGEGLVGETDDKIITFFSLGLVIFFTVFVILGLVDPGRARAPQAGAQGRRAPQARRLVARAQRPKHA